jgi:hypothetical protein
MNPRVNQGDSLAHVGLKTVNESNLAVFDYNRNVTSLTLYWNY